MTFKIHENPKQKKNNQCLHSSQMQSIGSLNIGEVTRALMHIFIIH